jgi:hypothetical protein
MSSVPELPSPCEQRPGYTSCSDLTDRLAGLEWFANNAELFLSAPAASAFTPRDDLDNPLRYDGSNVTGASTAPVTFEWLPRKGRHPVSGRRSATQTSRDVSTQSHARRFNERVRDGDANGDDEQRHAGARSAVSLGPEWQAYHLSQHAQSLIDSLGPSP